MARLVGPYDARTRPAISTRHRSCLDLHNKGFKPVVFDNLSNGHREFVKWGPLEVGDIRDRRKLDEVFKKYKPEAIMHFAAAIEVGEFNSRSKRVL